MLWLFEMKYSVRGHPTGEWAQGRTTKEQGASSDEDFNTIQARKDEQSSQQFKLI